jgi:hypothetical protein
MNLGEPISEKMQYVPNTTRCLDCGAALCALDIALNQQYCHIHRINRQVDMKNYWSLPKDQQDQAQQINEPTTYRLGN